MEELTVDMVKELCEEHDFKMVRMDYLDERSGVRCGCAVGISMLLHFGDWDSAMKAWEDKGEEETHRLTPFDMMYAAGLDHGFEFKAGDEFFLTRLDTMARYRPEIYVRGAVHGREIAKACARGEIPSLFSREESALLDDSVNSLSLATV